MTSQKNPEGKKKQNKTDLLKSITQKTTNKQKKPRPKFFVTAVIQRPVIFHPDTASVSGTFTVLS